MSPLNWAGTWWTSTSPTSARRTLWTRPFARAYKVLEVMPYNVKALKAWVKDNGIGVLDIKKRGTSVTPEELRKQLLPGGKASSKKAGNKTATLVLTRIGEDRVAIVVEPVSSALAYWARMKSSAARTCSSVGRTPV